jgi:cytochrome P450
MLGLFMDAWRRYGDVLLFRVGPRKIYLVLGPEHVKHVLVDHPESWPHPEWFDARVRAAAGKGVITLEGDTWRRRRDLLEPCFARDRLPPLDEPIGDSIAAQLDRWAPAARAGEPIDVQDDTYDLGLTIVGRVLFGRDWEAHAETVKPSVRAFIAHIDRLLQAPFNVPTWLPLPANLRFLATRRRYDATVAAAIASRRDDSEDGGILGHLTSARDHEGRGLTDEQVRDELTNAYAAGSSTVAATLMWTCFLLGLHPEVAARARAEANDVLSGRQPTVADLPAMPYGKMVVDEVLRLHPPLWVTGRSPLHDDELGGYDMPAGAFVSYSSFITHRHPEHWTAPESFDPERWAPGRDEPRSPCAYLPFSHGPRTCLGEEIGRAALRMFLPMLLARYDVHTVDDHPIDYTFGIALGAKHGVKVVLQEA